MIGIYSILLIDVNTDSFLLEFVGNDCPNKLLDLVEFELKKELVLVEFELKKELVLVEFELPKRLD